MVVPRFRFEAPFTFLEDVQLTKDVQKAKVCQRHACFWGQTDVLMSKILRAAPTLVG